MIQVKTNATKRNPDHRIELTETQITNFVIPRFKNMQRNWKVVDASNLIPGLKLHYHFAKGEVRVSFEEPGEGVAKDCDWYSRDDLVNLLPF